MNLGDTFNIYKRPSSLSVIALLVLLLFFSRFIFLLSPNIRAWGIDHLQFLSQSYMIIYGCCFLILSMLLFPKTNSLAIRIFEHSSNIFGGKTYLKWAIISLVSIPIFWFFRMPTNFLGDGYSIINNIGNELPVIYKWADIGAIAIADFINNLLPYSGLQSATYTHAIMSVVSGSISIFFFCGIAYQLSESKIYSLFVLSILIFSGWSLLFFGYVENYPLLWAFITGYIYFAIKYLNKKCGIVWPLLLLGLSHIIHLQSIFFAISFPMLLISRNPFKGVYQKYKKVILFIMTIFIFSGIAIFLYKCYQSLAFQAHFLPLLEGKPPADNYALISIPHIIDIINEYSLLIPIWPILLYLSIRNFKSAKTDSIWRFLASFSIGGLTLISILDPRLGMGRDWDLFALCGLGPSLLMLKTIDLSRISFKRYYPILALFSMFLVTPYFIVNLKYQPSIEYFNSLMELDREKSKSGMATLRDYYFRLGNKEIADSINLKMLRYFQNLTLVEYGQQLIDSGKIEQAKYIAGQMLQNEPYSSEGYALRGVAYLKAHDFENALHDFNMALQLEPYNPGNHLNLGTLCYYRKKYSEMFKHCRASLALNPSLPNVDWYMGSGFYALQQYDSGLIYFEKVLRRNPELFKCYKIAGYCAYYVRNKAKTNKYLDYYLERNPNDPDKDIILQIIEMTN